MAREADRRVFEAVAEKLELAQRLALSRVELDEALIARAAERLEASLRVLGIAVCTKQTDTLFSRADRRGPKRIERHATMMPVSCGATILDPP